MPGPGPRRHLSNEDRIALAAGDIPKPGAPLDELLDYFAARREAHIPTRRERTTKQALWDYVRENTPKDRPLAQDAVRVSPRSERTAPPAAPLWMEDYSSGVSAVHGRRDALHEKSIREFGDFIKRLPLDVASALNPGIATGAFLGDLTSAAIRGDKPALAMGAVIGALPVAGAVGRRLVSLRQAYKLPGEIAELHAAQGGTTTNLAGAHPTEGFVVSPYKARETVLDHAPTASEVRAFKRENKDLLQKEGHHIGTWFESESGKHYLDVSVVTPDKDVALQLGKQADQKAVFDLGTMEAVEVPQALSDRRGAPAPYSPNLGRRASDKPAAPASTSLVDRVANESGAVRVPFGKKPSGPITPPADWDPHSVATDLLMPHERARLDFSKAATKQAALAAKKLPPAEQFASAALAGLAKRGWYQNSAKALSETFGPDAPRFAALLAATSPQTSVEENLKIALRTWKEWNAAGRPADPRKLKRLFNRAEMGLEGARYPNAMTALTAPNPEEKAAGFLSGPKVDSFYANLLGDTQRVTLDTWMAKLAGMNEAKLGQSFRNRKIPTGKYIAYSQRVRETAKYLTEKTGREWTPAEVQETMWSWAKAATGATDAKAMGRNLGTRGHSLEGIPGETQDVVDFSTLLGNETYGPMLRDAGLTPPSPQPLPTTEVPSGLIDPAHLNALKQRMKRASVGKYFFGLAGLGAGLGEMTSPDEQRRGLMGY